MAVIGVSMVRNEIDVIGGCLRHMCGEVDRILIADNGSDDGTRGVLDALATELPITVVDDDDPAYYQSRKMSALAARAARGETDPPVIVPFDADELWYSRLGRLRDVLGDIAPGAIARAGLYNHFCTALDVDDADPFRCMVWRQAQPAPLHKVAFRWEPGAVIHQGNHGVDLPSGPTVVEAALEIRHFPYRSEEQFVAKGRQGAAAYAATDLPYEYGQHWRGYGEIAQRYGDGALVDVFRQHFTYLSPVDNGMVHDPAPYRRWES